MPMPKQRPHRSKQDYRTPPEFLRACERLLGIDAFSFDLAAHSENHIVSNYGSIEDDSLARDWSAISEHFGGWLWLNPPFDDIASWASKCRMEWARGAKIALLVPASVGSNWYRDHVHGHASVMFLNGRLSFDGISPYPKDCMLALYNSRRRAASVWDWRNQP